MRLADFEGDWRIDRTISEHPGTSRFDGLVRFVPHADGLDCTESGTLIRPDGSSFEASRRYLWSESGERIRVAFSDGRPFHDFSCAVLRPRAMHDCPPDTYAVVYDFRRWPLWSATWRVTGPRKDYTMRSRFARLDSAPQLRQDNSIM